MDIQTYHYISDDP